VASDLGTSEAGKSKSNLDCSRGKTRARKGHCDQVRVAMKSHNSLAPMSVVTIGPRVFRTNGLHEMARFGEERRLAVAKGVGVDAIFPTLYRTPGNKPSAKRPISDGLAEFYVLLIGWRGDWDDH
jgi:hypothetical protein